MIFFGVKSCLRSCLHPIHTLFLKIFWLTYFFVTKCWFPSLREKEKKFIFFFWYIWERFRLQKVGVAAGFWVMNNFLFFNSVTFKTFSFSEPNFEAIFLEKGALSDFDFHFFSDTMGPSFVPPVHFWRSPFSISIHFLARGRVQS